MTLRDVVAMLDPSDPVKAGQILGHAIAQISYDDQRPVRRGVADRAWPHDAAKEAAVKMMDHFEVVLASVGFDADDIERWRSAARTAYTDAVVVGCGLAAVH